MNSVNLRSLRFKLIWTHGAAIGLVVVCFGLTRYQFTSYRARQAFDSDLLNDARILVFRLKLGQTGFNGSMDGMDAGVNRPEPLFVMTDVKGNVLGRNAYGRYVQTLLSRGDLKGLLHKKEGFSKITASDGSSYRFVSIRSPAAGAFPEPAIVHVGRSLSSMESFLSEHRLLYFYSFPFILAVSCAVGWFLAGAALKPFEEITRTAEKITSENLNAQIVSTRGEEEIQRLVHSFNSMVRRLDESFQKMRRFNADVAHELRTPLAILQGENEVALRSPNLPEELQSVLVSNLEELDRLTCLVNNMLTLAEAETGSHILAKEPVDLNALLQDLIEQMRLLAVDRNIRIDFTGSGDLWIEADPFWLRRALVNMLDNAIKYSKVGGWVEVTTALENSAAKLTISDNGIGISAEDMPHIFDRLYRADPARSRVGGGAGLGLSLVKWVVEAHGGSIRATSRLDAGAAFEISLPSNSGTIQKA